MRVFIFCTYSVAGASPIGIVITSDEQMETLTEAFALLKSLFANNSFLVRATQMSSWLIIVQSLRETLYEVFPESTLLLCIFHILQEVWRWQFDEKHGVSANDRLEIMRSFRALVQGKEVDYFEELLKQFLLIPSLVKYPAAALYFTELGILIYKSLKIYSPKFLLAYWVWKGDQMEMLCLISSRNNKYKFY